MTTVQTSTTTLCIITFAEDAQIVERMQIRIGAFAEKHLCRGILLDATISGRESEPVHQGDVVRVGVKSMSSAEISDAVRSLLTVDVPCALFWAGHRIADERFEVLAALARSILIDSSRVYKGPEMLRDASTLDLSRYPYFCDLAYMRLLPWQNMIAQFFDDAELAADLPEITGLDIVSGSQAEAYYLAGWLGSRLQWQPCGAHEFCNKAGTQIKFSMQTQGESRRVLGVCLRTSGTTYSAELDAEAPDLVCLRVTGKHRRKDRCMPLHDVDMVSLVEAAMIAPVSDQLFLDTLSMVRALLAHAG